MPTSTELRGQAEVPKLEPQIEFSVGIFSHERVKHLNFTVCRSGAILPRNPPRTFHQQLLRVIKMEGVDVDRHPCASKQVRIVRFARREHGWGGASDAAKEQQLVKISKWVSREDRT